MGAVSDSKQLITHCSECTACHEREYPPVARCLSCGGRALPRPLPSTGRIFSSTTVWTGQPEGVSYTVAYIDLDGGPRVFGTVKSLDSRVLSEEVALIAVGPLAFARS